MPIEVPSADQLQRVAQREIVSRNTKLTDFSAGSALDAITGGGAVQVDHALGVLLKKFSGLFADTAEGDDLDTYASDRFGLTRQVASASVVELTVGRGTESGAFSVDTDQLFTASVGGVDVSFQLDSPLAFGASDNELTATATCIETGRAGNVDAGAITGTSGTRPGITVTNAQRAAGGRDVETDESFRARIRLYLPSLARATVLALERVALAVPGVQYATVDESMVNSDSYAALYVGDPEGAGNNLLADAVQQAIDADGRACGVEVRVFASARQEQALALSVQVRRTVDQGRLRAAILEALVALGDEHQPGESGVLSRVVAAVHEVGDQVRGVAVTSPASDVIPTERYHAIRYPEELVTIAFVEVA